MGSLILPANCSHCVLNFSVNFGLYRYPISLARTAHITADRARILGRPACEAFYYKVLCSDVLDFQSFTDHVLCPSVRMSVHFDLFIKVYGVPKLTLSCWFW